MGTDLTVVNAARVSFHKESEWAPWTPDQWPSGHGDLSDKDSKLIAFLARNGHWTPFSHPQIMMREKVPIFVARQRFKHMVGFTYNEVSRRYVDDEPEFYEPETWRGKPLNAKQGSSEEVVTQMRYWDPIIGPHESPYYEVDYVYNNFLHDCRAMYNSMIQEGIAPEQARMVLPQSMYTEYYVTGSLAAWARAYKLRIDSHAQKEIQELATQWDAIIRPLFPVSWMALTA